MTDVDNIFQYSGRHRRVRETLQPVNAERTRLRGYFMLSDEHLCRSRRTILPAYLVEPCEASEADTPSASQNLSMSFKSLSHQARYTGTTVYVLVGKS